MSFGEKIRSAIEKLKAKVFVDDSAIKELVKEIQRALIAADVEIALVSGLSRKIEDASRKEPPKGLSRKEFIIKNTYDLLSEMIGSSNKLPEKMQRIMLLGLYGAGKSTTCGKLAKRFSKRGKKVCLVAADTARPAAFEQLNQVAEKAGVAFFGIKGEKNSAKIAKEAFRLSSKYDVVILDSAGRSALDDGLVDEIKKINSEFKPDCRWLVIGADIGQIAKKQASAFNNSVGTDGVIITRMDGSAKGGGALVACHATGAKVYFIGVGEKVEDLQEFDAQRYLSRVLGYGDLTALLEKAQEVQEEEPGLEDLMQEKFNLDIFYKQLKAARKMGPLGKVLEMMGLSQQIPKEMVEVSEEKLDRFGVIMDSMTKKEKHDPELLNKNRIERIAKGSGSKEQDVRELIKQYRLMAKMFGKFKGLDEKSLKDGNLQKMMKKLGVQKKKKFRIR